LIGDKGLPQSPHDVAMSLAQMINIPGRSTMICRQLCAMPLLAIFILPVLPANAVTPEWTTQSGTTAYDGGSAVSADGLGNVYISGSTEITGGPDAFFSRYDSAGNLLWTRQFGTRTDDYGSAIAADGLGSIYVAGRTSGDLFGPNAGGAAGGADAYLTKYDAAGNQLWSHQFGTPGSDEATGVVSDGFGSVYVAGFTEGSLSGTYLGRNDAFVSKYNEAGTLLWSRQWGTSDYDLAFGVAVDRAGNVYITGATKGD